MRSFALAPIFFNGFLLASVRAGASIGRSVDRSSILGRGGRSHTDPPGVLKRPDSFRSQSFGIMVTIIPYRSVCLKLGRRAIPSITAVRAGLVAEGTP
jgi:hypothetical protein